MSNGNFHISYVESSDSVMRDQVNDSSI